MGKDDDDDDDNRKNICNTIRSRDFKAKYNLIRKNNRYDNCTQDTSETIEKCRTAFWTTLTYICMSVTWFTCSAIMTAVSSLLRSSPLKCSATARK